MPFEFEETTRHRILHGLDEIDLTLQHEDAIEAYETAHGIAWAARVTLGHLARPVRG